MTVIRWDYATFIVALLPDGPELYQVNGRPISALSQLEVLAAFGDEGWELATHSTMIFEAEGIVTETYAFRRRQDNIPDRAAG